MPFTNVVSNRAEMQKHGQHILGSRRTDLATNIVKVDVNAVWAKLSQSCSVILTGLVVEDCIIPKLLLQELDLCQESHILAHSTKQSIVLHKVESRNSC